jgi:hypothetical protein
MKIVSSFSWNDAEALSGSHWNRAHEHPFGFDGSLEAKLYHTPLYCSYEKLLDGWVSNGFKSWTLWGDIVAIQIVVDTQIKLQYLSKQNWFPQWICQCNGKDYENCLSFCFHHFQLDHGEEF